MCRMRAGNRPPPQWRCRSGACSRAVCKTVTSWKHPDCAAKLGESRPGHAEHPRCGSRRTASTLRRARRLPHTRRSHRPLSGGPRRSTRCRLPGPLRRRSGLPTVGAALPEVVVCSRSFLSGRSSWTPPLDLLPELRRRSHLCWPVTSTWMEISIQAGQIRYMSWHDI
jgi:hypothetical protein